VSDRYLLVKGRAGLGNRILCALTGILYARLAGRRLLVDWSDPIYAEGGLNVFHRYFRCPTADPADRIPATDSVAPAIWRGRLDESSRSMEHAHGTLGRESWRELSIDLRRL